MELINHTSYPAGLFRTVIDEQRFAASVLARITYKLDGNRLVESDEQPWQVSGPPRESAYGPMDSDEVFYKGGVDLFIFGHARAPAGREITQVEVNIEIGSFRCEVIVFGDRVWERRESRLIPSAPRPFKAIPLTLAQAFGGRDEWDGLAIPFADNPEGKGFYLEEGHAVGLPLPNIEDPDNLIASWDHKPEPVGVTTCSMQCGLRLRNGIELDEHGQLGKIRPVLFNAAFPRMILDQVEPGQQVRLSGVTESEMLAFEIPRTELMIRLQFDDEVIERPLAIDQIGIEVDERRVFIAYRYPFRYVMYPLQKRSCELFLKNTPFASLEGLRS